ncbi:CesT family type III secretion system chaperone [Pseudomonas citri]|uniref:CesT family type III secretion system chaperone n=1 Tax=Pseudomonas citri TaxID=2978349 RepID=UPI0021B5A79F|nr:CesT family type III secretion system chaperone [Pseudomonas citri]
MRPIEAREQLGQWLRTRGIADALEGQRERQAVRTANGMDCLLWLPLQDTTLFIFVVVTELTMPQDNDILALSMALNLEPSRTHGGSLGYNPVSRQLMLRSMHPMSSLDEPGLDRVITQLGTLAGSLKRYIEGYRHQQAAGRRAQKGPAPSPAFHLGARRFSAN